jgi:RNA polymerase sigma factor (sigma-70 family)
MAPSDHDLLCQYAHDGSQAAFATLVERHLNLVYSAARRQVRSPQLAEEVAQSVFVDLARAAHRFPAGTPLVAWLHVVSRRTAIDVIRRESRRQAREHQAAELARGESVESAMKPSPSAWDAVEPLLDEAVQSLDETDRSAILLRYFEDKSLREVGTALGASDDAAQKRVSRALERLRTFYSGRGIAVTAAGLATDLSAHALQPAPAALGSAITAGLATTPPVAAAATATLISMTLLEKSLLTATAVIALGGALFEGSSLRTRRRETAELRQQTDTLATQVRDTQTRRDAALREAAEGRTRLAQLAAAQPSPADAATEEVMTAWLARLERLRQLVRDRPELSIHEFELLTPEQWFQASRDLNTSSENHILNVLARLRQIAESELRVKLQSALAAYIEAHQGNPPDDPLQLAPYFNPPIPAAILARYKMTAANGARPGAPLTAIIPKSTIDPLRDSTWKVSLAGNSLQSRGSNDPVLLRAEDAFRRANSGTAPLSAEELRPYLPADVDPARYELRFRETKFR